MKTETNRENTFRKPKVRWEGEVKNVHERDIDGGPNRTILATDGNGWSQSRLTTK